MQHRMLRLSDIKNFGVNATVAQRPVPQIARSGPGIFGIGLSVPFMATGKTLVTLRLSAPPDAVLSIEAHGYATRFQKLRAVVNGRGDILDKGDELEMLDASLSDGVVSLTMAFTAGHTLNEALFVFCTGGGDSFTLHDFTFQHPPHQGKRLAEDANGTHFHVNDAYVFRNYVQVDFELLRQGAEITSLDVTCDQPIAQAQWWTGRKTAAAKRSRTRQQAAIGQLPSPVAMVKYGPEYGNHGHSLRLLLADYQDMRAVDVATSDAVLGSLRIDVRFSDRSAARFVLAPSATLDDPSDALTAALAAATSAAGRDRRPRFLELGGRGSASAQIRARVGDGFDYVSVDIEPGPNVDVVGDAHALSALFEAASFDIVYSHSVLEHLIAPWQVIVESNRVLRPGGHFIAYAPVTWPLHAEPWDFWRFSPHAWAGLLNPLTGFEIDRTAEIGRAAIVPSAIATEGMTRMQHDPAPLFSSVIARKIGDPRLNWSTELLSFANGRYDP